jgi:P27 family predicted phage terminase small subunit
MRGRVPRPAALAKLAGDRRAQARQSLELPAAIPVAPEWLDDDARREWCEIVPVLARMKVLTEADRFAVAQLADYLARYKHCGEMVRKLGYAFAQRDDSGKVIGMKRNPYVSMHLDYGSAVQKLLVQFGMTPSARSRITSNEQAKAVSNIFSRIASIQAGTVEQPRLE